MRWLLFLLPVVVAWAEEARPTLAELAGQPDQWPAQVTLTAPAKGVLLRDGKPGGSVLLAAGKQFPVLLVAEDGVVVRFNGTKLRLPVDKTDLAARLAPPEAAEPAAPSPKPAAAPAPKPAAAAPVAAPPGPPSEMMRLLVGKLVVWQNGAFKPYDIGRLRGVRYFGILFSAGWCGPCREFAPALLEAYGKLHGSHPEFEIVMVSRDRSPADMQAYVRDEAMPWPVLKYAEVGRVDAIEKLAGPGIPDLVLVDRDGRVLADSFQGKTYVGPDSVLEKAAAILEGPAH